MSSFQYAVFFESNPLDDSEKERIKRYFQKRRVSGGGECGPVEKEEDNIYRINFMELEAQGRVLGKKQHVIPLPNGGQMSVSVRQDTASPNPTEPQASGQQQQMSQSEDKKELEKTFPMNPYLLRYLQESPKAARVLDKQLSSIWCSAQLHPEEEVAVVSGEVQKGLGGASQVAERWELQVDKVFINLTEIYSYHYEFDLAKLKVLMDDPSFQTEDLRVYRDVDGYAVIVGQVGEVKERMKMLEERLYTTECPAPQGQYNLVEDEFTKEMNTHCPKVKISRHSSNTVLLDGPDEDVELGSTKLGNLIKTIKSKTVHFPKPLLDFMKSSGAVGKFQARFKQSLRSPVGLEAHSDLVLSSLSAEALEEAAVAVQRDLGEETLMLEGALVHSPALGKLKEALSMAKVQANSSSPRVEVLFHPGPRGSSKTTVQLVGYSDAVSALKDVLLDFKTNQAETQERLILPLPEMVDSFDRILALIGMKAPSVKITPSHSPSPSVLLSGPRCLVLEAQEALHSALACLTWDKLVLDGPGACQYFQGEGKRSVELVETSCQVLIREQQQSRAGTSGTRNAKISKVNTRGCQSTRPLDTSRRTGSLQKRMPSPNMSSSLVNQSALEVHLGILEAQQVDVLVVPMVNSQLTSTMVGSCLAKKAGDKFKTNFDVSTRGQSLAPGEVIVVDPTPSLGGCSKILFIQCLPWDGANGASIMALQTGLRRALEFCAQRGWGSVALPVIGPGSVLKFPLRAAVEALTDEIGNFGQTGLTGSVLIIRVVIKPDSPDSSEVFQYVFSGLSSNMVNWKGQVMFKSLTSDLDEITVAVGGGVNLQLVFGDITNENTDAVVNTTDFLDFQKAGVCRDILTLAGLQVETELRSARVAQGEVLVTQPGQFPCQAILHVCGQRDATVIQGLVGDIIKKCEVKRLTCVAIPAICAGEGGLKPDVVAGAILQGVKAITSTPLHCLSLIRVVLNKIEVFQAFEVMTQKLFPSGAVNTASPPASLNAAQSLQSQPPSPSASALDLSSLLYTFSSSEMPSEFLILGLSDKDVARAAADLLRLYQANCSQHSFTPEELASLSQEEVDELGKLREDLGLCVEQNQGHGGPGGQDTQGGWTVRGPKDSVNQVVQVIQRSIQGSLLRKVKDKEEDVVHAQVAWCILGTRGAWERFPKKANYTLEKRDTAAGVVDSQGDLWNVDLSQMEATRHATRQVAKLKRLENLPDFLLPLYWDNMATGENVKLVTLLPATEEYRRLKADFKRTATMTVLKIERVQNVHLKRAYEVRKKHVADKRGNYPGLGEKALYHGTSHDNSQSIIETGFDWRFSGQNATMYGMGNYFAVNASYSANPTYSRPGPDGSRLMFVARVLTGAYTQGDSTMKVPPARSPQQPNDRYDSVVNDVQSPTMFVVFNDSAAYPDYLITFK